MWGDSDHIKQLKDGEQPWPDPGKPLTEKEWKTLKAAEKGGFISKDDLKAARKGRQPVYDDGLDLKVAKRLSRAERDALKREWEQAEKAAKQAKGQAPTYDLAALKQAEWEAKAARRAEKEHQRALRDTIKAEKAARKEQQRAEANEWRWTREEKAAWKAAKKNGQYQRYDEPSSALDLSQVSSGVSCLGTMVSFALLAGLFLLVLLCFCGCY